MTSQLSKSAKLLCGIHAATICPMDSEAKIMEDELAAHIMAVTNVPGIKGLLLNGHAGEGSMLDINERGRVIEIARKNSSDGTYITAGVTAEATHFAIKEAEASARSGADAILVFPPNHWAAGVDTTIVVEHHKAIARACSLPMVLYKAPVTAGAMSYRPDIMKALLQEVDTIAAIKEGSWEVAAYEETWRQTLDTRPDVAVLGSGDEHLLTSYLIGSVGSQVSLAAIIPETIVALYDAVQRDDWGAARQHHETLYPLSVAIYRDSPGYLATARLKACLKLLGLISSDTVRRPMRQLDAAEIEKLRSVLNR